MSKHSSIHMSMLAEVFLEAQDFLVPDEESPKMMPWTMGGKRYKVCRHVYGHVCGH